MADAVSASPSQGGKSKAKTVMHKASILKLTKQVSRRLSILADGQIVGHVGAKYSKNAAVVYALNMTLGTGPLTLPFAFAQAGLLLGGAFLAICSVLGYITATYVIEAHALANLAVFEGAEDRLLDDEDVEIVDADGAPIRDRKSDEDLAGLRSTVRHNFSEKAFKIRERVELGGLGRRFLPWGVWQLLYACLFLYTFGCLCVYSVALTTSIESLLPFGEQLQLGGGLMVSTRLLVVMLLALIIFPLCFADMQKLRSLQSLIMAVRALALIAMLGGSILMIADNNSSNNNGKINNNSDGDWTWSWHGMPMVDPNGLPSLFANAVLAFMVHHSLPGLMAPLEDQKDSPKVIATSYGIAYAIYVVLGGTALLAFGTEVPQLYNMAFTSLPIPVVPQLLCGYPCFYWLSIPSSVLPSATTCWTCWACRHPPLIAPCSSRMCSQRPSPRCLRLAWPT
ncbi:unnamed protein product [Polarella glacialis]|uniref:Amino acid transporter transmembrane domain-containing protein n=1 Tax=Polarella glacialis TaxID=89957 RepID=A0A813JC51_POLGL|nr:unnamed protein product [Polarella glacialis]